MSPVTSARVAVIQDAQTLCIHYWLLASPSPSPLLDGTTAVPKWIPNESICQGLFAAGLDLMLLLCRWRDWLSPREPRAAGGQHSPRAWPGGTEAHFEQRAETDKGVKTVPTLSASAPKTTSSSDSSAHPCVCVTRAGHISLSHPVSSQMFLIHFSSTQLHM